MRLFGCWNRNKICYVCEVCPKRVKRIQVRPPKPRRLITPRPVKDLVPTPKCIRRRKRYTNKFKLQHLAGLARYLEANPQGSIRTYSKQQGVNHALTCRWRKSHNLRRVAELPWIKGFARLRSVVTIKSPFEAENEELFLDFAYKRQALGEQVDKRWFLTNIKRIVALRKPPGYTKFKASHGWLQNFLRRYRISHQVQTEKKAISNATRIPALKAFHRELCQLQRSKGTNVRDPEFGRFGPQAVWDMDQVPMPFARSHRRSYNFKRCYNWIRNHGPSGIEKRMCTLILTLRAAGEQIVPPFLLFRGQGCLKPSLRQQLDEANIPYGFNTKAWTNGQSSLEYLRFFHDIVRVKCPEIREHLLLMDNLGAQCTTAFVNLAMDFNIWPHYFPANCTHLVQPVDRRIAAWIKWFMGEMYKIEQEVMNKEWTRYRITKTLTTQVQRYTLLRWMRECWDQLQTMPNFISRAFISTGCLIRLDGTHAIHFHDIPSYDPFVTETA